MVLLRLGDRSFEDHPVLDPWFLVGRLYMDSVIDTCTWFPGANSFQKRWWMKTGGICFSWVGFLSTVARKGLAGNPVSQRSCEVQLSLFGMLCALLCTCCLFAWVA